MNYARLVRRNGKNSINSAKTAAKWRLFVLSINGDMLTDMDLRPEIADASASIEHNKRCSRKAQHINAKIDRERHCIVHQRIHRQGTCFIGADEEHILKPSIPAAWASSFIPAAMATAQAKTGMARRTVFASIFT